MKPLAALAISIPILLAQSERVATHSVTAVRTWPLGDITRVAIEVSGDFEFRTDHLYNPERVYFDVLNSRPSFEGRRLYSKIVEGDRLLQKIRVAETNPGITRVVLDLGTNVDVTTSKLSNPSRLIIELRAGKGPVVPTELPSGPVPRTAPPIKSDVSSIAPPLDAPVAPVVARTTPPAPAPKPILEKPVIEAPPTAVPAVMTATTATAKPAPAVETAKAPATGTIEPPKAARHTSTGGSSLTRALGLKVGRIVIDPGHGGHDTGTQGVKGLLEKDLVLDVSLRLGKLIEERMNAEVIFTRSDDTFIPLEGRTALANEKKADLFLSIHANSSQYPRIAGVETFYLNFTDSKEAMDVASRENATSQRSIADLQDLTHKIALHEKLDESKEFAGRIQGSLFTFTSHNVAGEKNRGIKKAPFVVLIGANMPSVLAEIGFLTNAREEALLRKPDYRQKLAEALYRGLSRYAESLSHFQVAQTTKD
jgi:N-acetylmuramoyl-L-alanine amidase